MGSLGISPPARGPVGPSFFWILVQDSANEPDVAGGRGAGEPSQAVGEMHSGSGPGGVRGWLCSKWGRTVVAREVSTLLISPEVCAEAEAGAGIRGRPVGAELSISRGVKRAHPLDALCGGTAAPAPCRSRDLSAASGWRPLLPTPWWLWVDPAAGHLGLWHREGVAPAWRGHGEPRGQPWTLIPELWGRLCGPRLSFPSGKWRLLRVQAS